MQLLLLDRFGGLPLRLRGLGPRELELLLWLLRELDLLLGLLAAADRWLLLLRELELLLRELELLLRRVLRTSVLLGRPVLRLGALLRDLLRWR